MRHYASLSDQIATWYDQVGPWLFYGIVWALVFAGTGLFIGAFVPFITGDSLVFAAGLVAATHPEEESIWIMAIGVGIAAFLGDQVGYTLGRHDARASGFETQSPSQRSSMQPGVGGP